MLTNATFVRLDTPTGQSTGGQLTYSTGAAQRIRCSIQDDTGSEKYEGPEKLTEWRAVIVRIPALLLSLAGLELQTAAVIKVVEDGDPNGQPTDCYVWKLSRRPFGSISYVEAQCLQT